MSFFSRSSPPAPQVDALPTESARAQRADRAPQHREVLRARHQPHLRAAAHQPRHQGGRVHLDHGAVGRRQVDAAAHHRHARQRLDRRVLLPRPAGAPARRQGAREAAQAVHRLRLPELSPARSPDRLREPRHPAVVSRHQEVRTREHGLRHPRQVRDRRQEGSLSESALRRPAAARRGRARRHLQPRRSSSRTSRPATCTRARARRSWSCSRS